MSDFATGLLQNLEGFDPSPLFVLSLLPYLAFLWWARQVRAFPRLALRGFQLTLLFVAVTIAAAIVAELRFGSQLADVDPLHGGAEAFLTLSNVVVMLGFLRSTPRQGSREDQQVLRGPDQTARPPEDGASARNP